MVLIKFKKETDNEAFVLPSFGHKGDACFDLAYYGEENIVVPAWDRALIPLGFSIEVPQGYELQIRPRSGLALKKGITVLNSPGCVDSGYRNEVRAILFNSTNEDFVVEPLMRVCQGNISKVLDLEFELVEKLSSTERDTGGFGSTGEKVGG